MKLHPETLVLLALAVVGVLPGLVAVGRGHRQGAPITLLGSLLPLAVYAQSLWWQHALAGRGLIDVLAFLASGQAGLYQVLPWAGGACWLGALIWACAAVDPRAREPEPGEAELPPRPPLPPHVARLVSDAETRLSRHGARGLY